MKKENLIKEFEEFDTLQFKEFSSLISSKDNGEIYPPYLPHIGKKYSEYKIMGYGMAQSINKPWEGLSSLTKKEKVIQMFGKENPGEIWIAPYRVMLSIIGVYLYAKHDVFLNSLKDVHQYVSATNYYKFSFSENGRDINPNDKLKEFISPDNYEIYLKANDNLVASELDLLNPSIIFTFRGRHIKQLKKLDYKVITINDPSWILRGAGGCLKKIGSWFRKIEDSKAIELVDNYINNINEIDTQYAGKKEAIKIYLLKYFSDFKTTKE